LDIYIWNVYLKNLLILLIPFFLFYGCSTGSNQKSDTIEGPNTILDQWVEIPGAPTANNRFEDIFFIDQYTGWLIEGSTGAIYKTSDGGRGWEMISNTGIFNRATGFVNEKKGWIGNLNSFNNPTTNRSLYETVDGGKTWSNISGSILGSDVIGICGMQVINNDNIVALGRWHGPAVFLKSNDGGDNWTATDINPQATGLIDVYFFDGTTGIIIGGLGVGNSVEEQESSQAVILRTEDGGVSWDEVYKSTQQGKWGWKISFPTPDVGYVSVQGPNFDGLLLKTMDGGETWEELYIDDEIYEFGFSGIGFIDENTGWIGASSTLLETRDGGETWENIGVGESVNKIIFVGDKAYASGKTVYVYESSK